MLTGNMADRKTPGVIGAAAVYLGATGIGVLMRITLAGWSFPIPFDHLLHAHSHALYFGWAAMPILATALPSNDARHFIRWASIAVVAMSAAFLAQGYGPVSIAASAVVMAVWYAGIVLWWRRSGDRRFAASLAYVLVASLGVWVLGALQASDRGDGLAGNLAVHAFLSTFAWSLVLGTLAFLERSEAVEAERGRRVTRWWAALAWSFFPLGVIGGPEVPALGWVARAAALVALAPALWWVTSLWKTRVPALRAAAVWLAAAALGLAAVAVGGSPVLSWVGRPGVVFYLHALLLGYVSTVLVWHSGERGGVDVSLPLRWHHVGVATMLAGVLAPLVGVGRAGSLVAAIGAVGVWVVGWWWTLSISGREHEEVAA